MKRFKDELLVTSRRRPVVTLSAIAGAALLVAACGGGSPKSTNTTTASTPSDTSADTSAVTSAANQTSAEYGSYVGNAGPTGGMSISFTASPSGISGLIGNTLVTCAQTTGNSADFAVSSTIPLSGNSFTSDTSTTLPNGDGTAELKVAGSLDGSGHASGTLSYNNANVCDTGTNPIQWSASIGGSTTPTTAPSTSGCSPQPCDTSDGLTLSVAGLHIAAPAGPGDTTTLLEATFTVANNDTAAHHLDGSIDYYQLQPGNGASIVDDDVRSLTLSDGSSCRGDTSSLSPGAHSPTLTTCFTVPTAQAAGPFKFIWSIDNAGGTIDLSNMAVSSS